ALAILGLLEAPSLSGHGQEPATGGPAEMTDLLRSTPFDRITLSDGSTLIVDPVSPRPLPTIDPAKSRKHEKARARDRKSQIPLEGNIGLPGEPSKFKMPDQEKLEPEEDDPARDVKIHLLQEAEVRDFTVKRSSIKSIEYFEDLLLGEADRLILS